MVRLVFRLYLIKLFNSSYPEGNFGGKPATRWSISLSLYLIKLRNCPSYPEGNFGGNQLLDGSISCPSYPEGNFGGNQLLDGSISLFAPILRYDERFARQYRYEPPSEFPL